MNGRPTHSTGVILHYWLECEKKIGGFAHFYFFSSLSIFLLSSVLAKAKDCQTFCKNLSDGWVSNVDDVEPLDINSQLIAVIKLDNQQINFQSIKVCLVVLDFKSQLVAISIRLLMCKSTATPKLMRFMRKNVFLFLKNSIKLSSRRVEIPENGDVGAARKVIGRMKT